MQEIEIHAGIIEIYLQKINAPSKNRGIKDIFDDISNVKDIPPFFIVILCYYLSNSFFLKARRYTSASYQLRKILELINTQSLTASFAQQISPVLENELLKEVLLLISNTSNGTDRPQLLALKKHLQISAIDTPPSKSPWLYANISNSPEVKEAILLFANFSVKNRQITTLTQGKDFNSVYPEQKLISNCNTITSQWIRLMELSLQVRMNQGIINAHFKKCFVDIVTLDIISRWGDNDTFNAYAKINIDDFKNNPQKIMSDLGPDNPLSQLYETLKNGVLISDFTSECNRLNELVCNSIFCLSQSLHIAQSYGNSYPVGNFFIAELHRELGRWLMLYHLCIVLGIITESEKKPSQSVTTTPIEEMACELLSVSVISMLDPISQFQLAKTHYYKTLSMHHSGDVFVSQFREMHYLEDDFNDNLNHFSIAMERFYVNNGTIRENIIEMEKLLDKSQIFKYSSFVN